MRLRTSTDFGLRALMLLAARPDRTVSTNEMATGLGISRDHLTKVVQALAKAGFVATRRGKGGGFALARPADTLTLGEVVRALEADQPIVECFRADGGACTLTPGCRLKGRLIAAREAFLRELEATSLADCAYPDGLAPSTAGASLTSAAT
jgi:Rrf2 family nitric oxide-sensitive transcriptional repressor